MNRSEDLSLIAMAFEATTFREGLRNIAGCLRNLVVSRAKASRHNSLRRPGLSCKPASCNALRLFFGSDADDGTWLAFASLAVESSMSGFAQGLMNTTAPQAQTEAAMDINAIMKEQEHATM